MIISTRRHWGPIASPSAIWRSPPTITPDGGLLREARQAQSPLAVSRRLLIVSGAEYGQMPAERFAAVARAVVRGCQLSLAGARSRATGRCEEVAQRAGGGVLNLAGQTSLRQLMALLKLCRVVLTNDSGPMHVAAALGTPVVVPFGSTSPALTGPGQPGDPRHRLFSSDAPCAPCFRRHCPIDLRCLTAISADDVAGGAANPRRAGRRAARGRAGVCGHALCPARLARSRYAVNVTQLADRLRFYASAGINHWDGRTRFQARGALITPTCSVALSAT